MPTVLHTLANSVMERVRRSPLYFERYNNTCDFTINRNYTRYARECAAAFHAQNSGVRLAPSPLAQTAATLVRGAFPKNDAQEYSRLIGELIANNDPRLKQVNNEGRSMHLNKPLTILGPKVLQALDAPGVHEALLAFFHSHYRVEWVTCFRSLPSETVAGSWLWHSDSFPPHTCKMFLHLTSVTAETGATQFMNREDTMAYRRAGYFGQFQDERYAELQDFGRDHGLAYRPFSLEADAGDATIFDMNYFHRAVSPRSGFRDVVCFLFLPNPVSWREQMERDGGFEQFSQRSPGKLPKDPHPVTPR